MQKPYRVKIESDRYPAEEMAYATEAAAREAYARLRESAAAWGAAFGVLYTITYLGQRSQPAPEPEPEPEEQPEEETEEEAS